MTNKKAFSLILTLVLILGLAACTAESKEPAPLPEPEYTPAELDAVADFESAVYHAAGEEIRIPADVLPLSTGTIAGATPDTVWQEHSGTAGGFTLPEAAALPDGSLGTLRIPRIGLVVSVYETVDGDAIESMKHGAAHLPTTSAWDGNVGLAAHNRGVNTIFGQIHTLQRGDEITLETAQGTRTYLVETIQIVDEMDWSMLGRTEDNRITLVTCIDAEPTKRLIVQGAEKSTS